MDSSIYLFGPSYIIIVSESQQVRVAAFKGFPAGFEWHFLSALIHLTLAVTRTPSHINVI